MLVLSRRQGQRILFPNLGISVQVLPGKSSPVRLGIEAPADVSILREDLAGPEALQTARTLAENKARHDLGGRLNTLAMALHVVEKQLKAGLMADAERTVQEAQEVLEKLS